MGTKRRAGRVPAPPEGMAELDREVWLELAAAVQQVGAWSSEADLPAFRLLVHQVALTRAPSTAKMPATAQVRLLQATATLLSSWGLTPGGRARLQRQLASARWLESIER